MEACKSEQEGLKREKEEQLYASLEGLKVELDAYRNRTSALDGEDQVPVMQPGFIADCSTDRWQLCGACRMCWRLLLSPVSRCI